MSGARSTKKTTSTTRMTRRAMSANRRGRRSGGAGADHCPGIGARPGGRWRPASESCSGPSASVLVVSSIWAGCCRKRTFSSWPSATCGRSGASTSRNLVDKKYGNTDCKMYADMREFLATRSDIDALLIATGDRWHATATIMAMRAGKDVYSEKPSCMTIAEGRAVVQTGRHYGRIYQTGTQRLSEANFVAAIELARTGRLGKVHTARARHRPVGRG